MGRGYLEASGAVTNPEGPTRPPVQPGQTVELAVQDLGHAGEGVGRYQGFTVFVPGALPGEQVRARIEAVKPAYGRGRLLAVLTAAEQRVAPPCPAFGRCGGCQLQHLAYPEQLAAKTRQVAAALARIGKLAEVEVLPTIGMADPWHYRNKAQFPVGVSGQQVLLGWYAAGSHRIVDVDECGIQHPTANLAIAAVRRLIQRHGIPVYDEQRHQGLLRHVLVRTSAHSGQALLALVVNGSRLPRGRELAAELMRAVPGLVSVWLNVNRLRTNVVLGPDFVHLAGELALEDRIGDLEFQVSPPSFFQVNPVQTLALYRQAVAYADLAAGDTAIDVYCGAGTISLFLARQAAQVYGIEVAPAAVADAEENARRNRIANARFLAGPAETLLPNLAAEGVRPRVVVLDPPRQGCAPAVLAAAAAMVPERIVYVSCNPSTLARDLADLVSRGYRAVSVQPVDMFPQTAHVECCALLVRDGPSAEHGVGDGEG